MIKYKTEKFDFRDEDVLWEKFMCFIRSIIPYEKHWNNLSECQKYALIVFIYDAEVFGEGHIGFLELHSDYISFDDVIKAMEILQISNSYIENIRKIPIKQVSLDAMFDSSQDEEEYTAKMDELDRIFEAYDRTYYQLAMESTEIQDKILRYLQSNIDVFLKIELYKTNM